METNSSFSKTLLLFENKYREYLGSQDKLNGNLLKFYHRIYPNDNFYIIILGNILDQNTALVNDLKGVMKTVNEQNSLTSNIYSIMKEQVNI